MFYKENIKNMFYNIKNYFEKQMKCYKFAIPNSSHTDLGRILVKQISKP